MTSLLATKLCSLTRFCSHSVTFKAVGFRSYDQIRLAGHAKWQNIRGTKQANDLAKGKLISRYVQMVHKAIVTNGMKTDPKLNSKLADVLSEANKFNVPKATLERAIIRASNLKIIHLNLEIEGPGKCTIIARCETENVSTLRRDVKKVIKKHEGILATENTLINMFRSQGFIRTTTKTSDGREVTQDFAEDAAIISNAEEVYLEEYEDATDQDLRKVWVFRTDAQNLEPCRVELEKQQLNITSSDLDLVPYNAVDFGPDIYEKAVNLMTALKELEQIVDVYHNLIVTDS